MYTSDNWDYLFERGSGTVVPTSVKLDAVVVEKEDRPRDHYGDYMQDENECWMIFKVVENGKERFFKKTGTQSSYGDERDWSWGTTTEVFPKTKTITVWE